MATRRKNNKQQKTRKMRRGGFWPFTSSTATAPAATATDSSTSSSSNTQASNGESWWTRLWKTNSDNSSVPVASTEVVPAASTDANASGENMKLTGGSKKRKSHKKGHK